MPPKAILNPLVNQIALGSMNKCLCIIALFAFVIVSCTSKVEVGTPFFEGQEVTITASVANNTSNANQLPGKQRVSGKDTGATIDLTWNTGDKILVRVGDKSTVFTLSSGENTSLGTFTGKMPADGSEYSVSYPVDYSDDILAHQTYVENGIGNGLMKMSTKSNGTLEDGFMLSADNAVLGLQLTGSQTLGKIVLTNTATAKIYTLHCDGVVLKAEAVLFYIVVPIKEWVNGMRVEVYDNDGDIILMKEKAGEIMFSATDAMVMPTLQTHKRGKRIGVFSVGKGKYVSFSQGNLQYIQSTKEWLFAKNQFEYIGAANVKGSALADKIDLFGWSSDKLSAPFGISTSVNPEDYRGNFVDWGVNIIQGDRANTWRTLSVDEWGYLFKQRANANELYSKGNVDGLRGMIVLPDDWVLPEGLHFTAQPTNLTMNLDINTYTLSEWNRMEEAGAVFFCPTGRRDGTTIGYLEYYGCYWSKSRTADNVHTCHMYYNYNTQIFMTDYKSGDWSFGTNGRAVRLVHDTIPPVLTFTVNGVSFDMIYVEGGTFMMGADEAENNPTLAATPVHEVTLSDYYIGETEITQPLWTAIMETNIQDELRKGGGDKGLGEGDNYPMYAISWYDSKAFALKLSEVTGMKFRLPTEAEWEYAARGGKYSRGYKYAGSNTLDEVAWHTGNSTVGGKYVISPVKLKKPNELGLYDMTGNIWEWCQDRQYTYTTDAQINPVYERTDDTQLVIERGGSTWAWGNDSYRVYYRKQYSAYNKKTRCGLRLVLECE